MMVQIVYIQGRAVYIYREMSPGFDFSGHVSMYFNTSMFLYSKIYF